MSIQIESFGERARLFTLENSSGTRLVLTDIGASAVSLVWRGTDILLGWEDPDRYFNGEGCHGATIGRVANRVADSRSFSTEKPMSLSETTGKTTCTAAPTVTTGASGRPRRRSLTGSSSSWTAPTAIRDIRADCVCGRVTRSPRTTG